MRYFLQLSYLGTPFNGWQRQKNSNETVQQCIETALTTVLRETCKVTGCGRTDTGVHARGYWAHFDAAHVINFKNTAVLLAKLNAVLPESISVDALYNVSQQAHARFDALSRSYEYLIIRKPNPFFNNRAWFVYGPLDIEAMNHAVTDIVGHNDFKSFCKAHGQQKTTYCTIQTASWTIREDGIWCFSVTADRFLRGMVRALVGTMVQVGQNKRPATDLKRIREALNRMQCGPQAPAHGLYFTGATYLNTLFNAG